MSDGADTPEGTGSKQAATQFKPGQSGNPRGRPKGSRNKLGEDFITALQASLQEHGPATVETVRTERPHEYLKVIASILPKELNVNTTKLTEMSDDELVSALEGVRSVLLALAPEAVGAGSEEAARH